MKQKRFFQRLATALAAKSFPRQDLHTEAAPEPVHETYLKIPQKQFMENPILSAPSRSTVVLLKRDTVRRGLPPDYIIACDYLREISTRE